MSCISNRLPNLMRQQSIGLIIIDSIAGVFRVDTDAIARANNMRKVVLTLQTLADEHESAVVCVNQVWKRKIKSKIIRYCKQIFYIFSVHLTGNSFNE